MGIFVFGILLNKPSNLHDRHAITIIVLSSNEMIAIYLMRVRVLRTSCLLVYFSR